MPPRAGSYRPRPWRAWANCTCLWLADLRIDGERRYVPLGHDAAAAARAAHAQLLADRPVGELIYLTGLRIGEVLALVPEVIDLERGVLRVDAAHRNSPPSLNELPHPVSPRMAT